MERWRDNGRAYALGLAVLSFPITVAFLLGIPPRNAFGLLIAGTAPQWGYRHVPGWLLAYALTQGSGPVVERVALMSPIVVGLAFFVASLLFVVVYVIGMVIAWWLSVTTMGAAIFVLTIVWSFLYLAMLGPASAERPRRALFVTNRAQFGTAFLCGIPGVATIGLALWKLPSTLP